MSTRTETDLIGKCEIPKYALYGIHAWRARENFPDTSSFPIEWYKATGLVKKACYQTYQDFTRAVREKFPNGKTGEQLMDDQVVSVLIDAAGEVAGGKHFEQFIVPGISGGAGTSINMNINEIIANRSLVMLGLAPGIYQTVDPVEHANIFQSTNDVIPTALKVALMFLLKELEGGINLLRNEIERAESENRNALRVGYTQMQEAVPSSYGMLFSAYSEALSRDWWRVSKCFERLKLVNLGGGAIGTGMAIPRFFIMEAIANLQKLTGLPVARSENLPDTTSNLDAFVEVHAILKSHAVSLEKMVSDLRLLASDLNGNRELQIPRKQAGSSIMPGKVNPVIPEFVISAAHQVYANDQLITSLCSLGCLELNAYLPLIGKSMIESIRLMIAADNTIRENLITGMQIDAAISNEKLFRSPSITTALIPLIGYHKAAGLALLMKEKGISVMEANKESGLIPEGQLLDLLQPENLLKLGYTLNDKTDQPS